MSKSPLRFALAGAAGLFALAAPALAHHSTAMFDWGNEKKMDNVTVEKWVWTNPHTFLYVRDASGTRWAFEGMSPNHLVRNGWDKDSLQPGEKINLTYYPLRDTRKGGFDVTVTKPNGTTMRQLPGPPKP
jgi:hypothetical protein